MINRINTQEGRHAVENVRGAAHDRRLSSLIATRRENPLK